MSENQPEAAPRRIGIWDRLRIGQLMSQRPGESFLDLFTPESQAELISKAVALSRKTDEVSAREHAKVLRIAGKMETSPDAFRSFLPTLLIELGIDLPAGVLKPAAGRPGRRREPDNAQIYAKWVTEGHPAPGSQDFARACFGKKFSIASPKERRRMVNRCYLAVKRGKSMQYTSE
jgi:hypothetical protein